jgi:hypothetical protein
MCKLEFRDIKLSKLKLLAGILVFSQITMAQTVSTFGLELGITFSQFPKWEYQDMANTKITDNPLPGPLIGISKKWILSKHFHFTSGLQYQMAGRRYHIYNKANNYPYFDNLTIHKICIPLDLGFGFKIGRFKPSFYLGLRPNIWLSAKETDMNYKWNLFDTIEGTDGYKPPKRLLCQFSTGFSSPIGQHFQIKINFNYGYNYYVTTSEYQGNHSHFTFTQKTSIASSDYIISVVYHFNRSKSRNSNNKNG